MASILDKAELEALLGGGPAVAGNEEAIYRQAAAAAAAGLASMLQPGSRLCVTAAYTAPADALRLQCGVAENTPLLINEIGIGSPQNCKLWAIAAPADALRLDEAVWRQLPAAGDAPFAGYCKALEMFCSRFCSLLAPATAANFPAVAAPAPRRWLPGNTAPIIDDDTAFTVLELSGQPEPAIRLFVLVPPHTAAACSGSCIQPTAITDPCVAHQPAAITVNERILPSALAGIPLDIAIRVSAGQLLLGAVACDGATFSLQIPTGMGVEVQANGRPFAAGTIAHQGAGYLLVQVRLPASQ